MTLISETVQDVATVTVVFKYELICAPLSYMNCSDLDWSLKVNLFIENLWLGLKDYISRSF